MSSATSNWLTDNTHPSHDWQKDDDVISCDLCGVRTYNTAAADPCSTTKPSLPVPTTYFDEKIGGLETRLTELVKRGEARADQVQTLRDIADYANAILMEAQKWTNVLLNEGLSPSSGYVPHKAFKAKFAGAMFCTTCGRDRLAHETGGTK